MPRIALLGEKDKIEDLITNLIGNALKYTCDTGDKTIHIELSATSSQITLSVRDSGIGISEKDLPHIFDRFYRAENNRMCCTRGTGLGLTICKKIVELHSGTIRAESTLGEGTLFTITFPRTV